MTVLPPLTYTTSFIWARQLHRLSLFATVTLMGVLALTGALLKFRVLLVMTDFNRDFIREIHGDMALVFCVAFGVMALTGLWMYVFPQLPKSPTPPSPPTTPQPTQPPQPPGIN